MVWDSGGRKIGGVLAEGIGLSFLAVQHKAGGGHSVDEEMASDVLKDFGPFDATKPA